MIPLVFLQDQKIQKAIDLIVENTETLQAVQEELAKHHDTSGIPLAIAIPIASALVAALTALWAWGRAQQKRGDESYKQNIERGDKFAQETIALLTGKITSLNTTLQESTKATGDLTAAINGQKEALYKLRDNQVSLKEKVTEDLAAIMRKLP